MAGVLPRPDEKAATVEAMFDRIASRYDRMNRLLTLRMDVAWRRAAVREIDGVPGALVLDLACGTGDFCRDIGRAGYTPIGFDFSDGMLRAARTTAPLVRADVLQLPVPSAAADAITCGFALRNLSSLEPFFGECARALRADGRVVLLEVGAPNWWPARAIHSFYFRRVVPAVGGALSDRAAYSYLPASTAYLPASRELTKMLRRAGFHNVLRRSLGFGAAQLIVGTRA